MPDPDALLGRVVMERIAELLRYRRWWRANRWADWPTVRYDLDTELRALLRLAREARRRPEAERTALAAGDFYAGMPR